MKKYKFAIFDWDGCLADTLANAKRIHLELAKRKGIAFDEADLHLIYGDWEKASSHSGYSSVEEYRQNYTTMVRESILDVELNPRARELLEILYLNKIPLGIVTTSSREYILKQSKNENIENFFQFLVGIEDVENPKPHPEPVLKMMGMMGAVPEETLMIGDTDKDIIASAEAGIDNVFYSPLSNQKFYGKMNMKGYVPTYTIKGLFEVVEFF